MYVPFDYNYTPKTKEFVTSTTEKFYACLRPKMQMELFSALDYLFPVEKGINDTCDIERISEDYYIVSQKGYQKCQLNCSTLNASYVKFLNKTVGRLSEHFFAGMHYVKLYPIYADVGACVKNEEKKTYDCECKLNYQITIHRDFYESALNILNGDNHNNRDIKPIDYFVTVLFFLKFLPHTAPLYIAFVFYIQKLRWTKNDRLTIYPDLPFVDPYSQGKVEETNLFPNVHDKFSEKIVKVTKFEELDINIFVDAFHKFNLKG